MVTNSTEHQLNVERCTLPHTRILLLGDASEEDVERMGDYGDWTDMAWRTKHEKTKGSRQNLVPSPEALRSGSGTKTRPRVSMDPPTEGPQCAS